MRFVFILGFAFATLLMANEDPKKLVQEAVEKVGGLDRLHQLKDVEYLYTFQLGNGNKDISLERYIFDGELSWAKYHQMGTQPELAEKEVIQGFTGKNTWVTVDGQMSSDEKMLKRADFLRKTNYYWFAMMFKLADPGTYHKYEGTQQLEGIDYHLVRLSFEEGIGDVQDTYLLFINPYTGLVDQFLFTVMDFGVKDPYLMKIGYVSVDGVMLPASRRFTKSDWQGSIDAEAKWNIEMMTDIKFDNGFKPADFAAP